MFPKQTIRKDCTFRFFFYTCVHLIVFSIPLSAIADAKDTEGTFKRATLECQRPDDLPEYLPDCLPGDPPERISFNLDGLEFEMSADGVGMATYPDKKEKRFSVPVNEHYTIRFLSFAKIHDDIFLLYEVSDSEGAGNKLSRLSGRTLELEWSIHIPAFNAGEPLWDGRYLYVTGIGFVGKVDISLGSYVWKHDGLYERHTNRFNSFSVPEKADSRMIFKDWDASVAGKNIPHEATILIDDETGKIVSAIYLGVLTWEDFEPRIRVTFIHHNGSWKSMGQKRFAYMTIPEKVEWTLIFDGKKVGKIASKALDWKQWVSDRLAHEITSDAKELPSYNNKDGEFAGWSGAHKYRPIVLASEPNYKDPDAWKRTSPDEDALLPFKTKFKEEVTGVVKCSEDGVEVLDRNYQFTDSEIKFLKGYKSKDGSLLVGLRLEKGYCDGPLQDERLEHWFYGNEGKVDLIGHSIHPVDASDYDADGKSEWVFLYSGYNEDGYWLYEGPETEPVKATWGYH